MNLTIYLKDINKTMSNIYNFKLYIWNIYKISKLYNYDQDKKTIYDMWII